MSKEKNFISAVIYVYNSELCLEEFLKAVLNTLEQNFEHSEIICVNDGSSDKSVEVIRKVSTMATTCSISVIKMSSFHGLELAMNAGTDLAIGDFVFEFDHTDLDFEPELIMSVYARALSGYDVVSARPKGRGRFTSNLFYFVYKHFADTNQPMFTECFRILSRRVINRVSDIHKSIPYRKAVYADSGLKMDSIEYTPIVRSNRRRIDRREYIYRKSLAMDSLILFTNVGYCFSITMAKIMILIMAGTIIYSLFAYIYSKPVSGWTSTIMFLSVAFIGLFGIMTIVIKYLQIIVGLVFRRKQYTFESIEKYTR